MGWTPLSKIRYLMIYDNFQKKSPCLEKILNIEAVIPLKIISDWTIFLFKFSYWSKSVVPQNLNQIEQCNCVFFQMSSRMRRGLEMQANCCTEQRKRWTRLLSCETEKWWSSRWRWQWCHITTKGCFLCEKLQHFGDLVKNGRNPYDELIIK